MKDQLLDPPIMKVQEEYNSQLLQVMDPSRLKAQKEYNQQPLQVKPEMTIILFRNLKQDQGRTLAIV